MLLTQNKKTGNWTTLMVNNKSVGDLTNVHPESACANANGCAIHNRPSAHPLHDAPMNWREDRGILERICSHGVGHPDADSAAYLSSIGQGYQNVHGCDGCC